MVLFPVPGERGGWGVGDWGDEEKADPVSAPRSRPSALPPG